MSDNDELVKSNREVRCLRDQRQGWLGDLDGRPYNDLGYLEGLSIV